MSCITEKLRIAHLERVETFREELKVVARETKKKDSVEWIAQRISFMEMAWRDQAVEELHARSRIGRFCHAFYIDLDDRNVVDMVSEWGSILL